MKKRFLTMLLALVMIICALPIVASASQFQATTRRCNSLHKGWSGNDNKTVVEILDPGTCQTKGYVQYKCTYDGILTGKCNNTWTQEEFTVTCHTTNVQAKAATCTEDGNTAGITCSDCQQSETRCAYCAENFAEVIEAAGAHTPETLPAVLASCTATGLTAGEKCSVCGTVTVAQEVVGKTQHTPEEIPNSAPTCSRPGTSGGEECSVCGEILTEPTTTPATNQHVYGTFVETKVAATCIRKGIAIYKCNTCELTQEQETDFSSTHNWKYVRPQKDSPLNCTTPGVGVYECEDCEETSAQDTSALGHDPEVLDVIREGSCTESSVTKYSCNRCTQTWIDEVAAPDHKPKDIAAVEPTCTTTGLTKGEECEVCGEILKEQEEIRTAEHDWEEYEEVAKTCTADGHSAYKQCKDCETTQDKVVYPAAHTFEDGSRICKDCGAGDVNCQHPNAEINTVKSTCTVAGTETFDCPDCKYHFVEQLPLAKHKEEDHSRAATCTQKGLVHKVCGVCGQDIERYETNKLEHTYVNGFCSGCGVNSKPNCSHPRNRRSTERVNSTCTEHGYEIVTCTECRAVVSANYELPLASHTYVNRICSACGHRDSSKLTNDYQDFIIVG